MNDQYMRTMIYLKKKDDLTQSVGYLRLERKEDQLLFFLALTGTSMPEHSPIYLICSVYGQNQPCLLGKMLTEEYSEGSVCVGCLPLDEEGKDICGTLIGTQENYLCGSVDGRKRFEFPDLQNNMSKPLRRRAGGCWLRALREADAGRRHKI